MEQKSLMRVLVTGGSGLVGNGIRIILDASEIDNFHFASSADGDLEDIVQTASLFDRVRPTHVIHLAAKVGGLFANMKDNLGFFQKNMNINKNVLECCYQYNVQKCVSCLSTCIFPDEINYPITESQIHNGVPHSSNYGYSFAKRMLLVLSQLYNEKIGQVRFVCVIPTNIFGPGDNYDLENGHVVANLIKKAYSVSIGESESIRVCGTGKPLRQFMFAPDLGKLLLWVMYHYNDNEPIILSPDQSDEISISNLVHLIAECFHLSTNVIEFDNVSSNGQFKKTASNQKLRNLYPDFQFTPLSVALAITCDFFKMHQK